MICVFCSQFEVKRLRELGVVKPNPKQLLWPIMIDEDSSMNQSEYEAIACYRRQAREKARVQVAIGLANCMEKPMTIFRQMEQYNFLRVWEQQTAHFYEGAWF